jgi:hypothetical protein
VFILGNDDAESDERNANRSSDGSYLTEDTTKKKTACNTSKIPDRINSTYYFDRELLNYEKHFCL